VVRKIELKQTDATNCFTFPASAVNGDHTSRFTEAAAAAFAAAVNWTNDDTAV